MSALELLVAAAIVATVAAVGVPTLHARSERAILDANVRGLAEQVQGEMLEGCGYEFVPGVAAGDADEYLSVELTTILQSAVGNQRYLNPYASDPAKAHLIMSASTLPAAALDSPPAVYLTDSPECRWEVFDQQPFEQVRRHLAGALVIQFNTAGCTIDVFYVDSKGNRSPDVERLPAV